MRYALLFLLLLSACSAPDGPAWIAPPETTVDMGADPLNHEADTTVTIALRSSAAITQIQMLGSTRGMFFPLDTIRRSNSLTITFGFIPLSTGTVHGACTVLSGSDTLAQVWLVAECTPFAHRIGDSYVFANDSSGKTDSVWVSALPLMFSTTDSTYLDRIIRSISDRDTVWPCTFYGVGALLGPPRPAYLMIGSVVGFDSGYSHIDSSGWGSEQRESITSGRIPKFGVDTVDGSAFTFDRLKATITTYARAHLFENDGLETFTGNYSPDLGFFTHIADSIHDGFQSQNRSLDVHNAMHLVRYHFRR